MGLISEKYGGIETSSIQGRNWVMFAYSFEETLITEVVRSLFCAVLSPPLTHIQPIKATHEINMGMTTKTAAATSDRPLRFSWLLV